MTEREVDAAVAFVEWLATGGEAPVPDVVAGLETLPDALLERLEERDAPLLTILVRLCGHPQSREFLPRILAEKWEQLAELLGGCEVTAPRTTVETSASDPPAQQIVYLLLRLAEPSTYLYSNEVKFLHRASRYDPTMLRHLLAWAAREGPGNRGQWHFGDDPAPDSIWEHEADGWRQTVGHGQGWSWSTITHDDDGSKLIWTTKEAVALARRLPLSVGRNPADIQRFRLEAGRLFSTLLDAFVELAKLDLPAAKTASAGCGTLSTFTAWANECMHLEPRFWLASAAERIVPALPILPLEDLDEKDEDLDDLDGFHHHDRERFLEEHTRWRREQRRQQQLAIGWAVGVAIHKQELPRVESQRVVYEKAGCGSSRINLC